MLFSPPKAVEVFPSGADEGLMSSLTLDVQNVNNLLTQQQTTVNEAIAS